ncbi:uncharacterized protein LOC115632995 [Scaptodrosophila lebanonensis]|uniref:Uncharacterized protein LOC115632995 n=1 Tax=Drosophila lebanonensis TaxID=7225 RepID=A0A6J2UDF1_DROLE|nr:uncharacterized protein LOC115632995 [Scaptodrosophila lebanonensis]
MYIKLILFFSCLCLVLYYTIASKSCPLQEQCRNATATSAVCVFEEKEGCIRKFVSKCHMEIAACREHKDYSDSSDVYCEMETYLCEEGYERWTIFFGNEKALQ